MSPDRECLENLAAGGGRREAALEAAVARHGRMVYNACLRVLDESHAAEDAAQAVFLVLLRKAGRLSPRTSLGAWLHRTATFAAHKLARSERRRVRREKEAAKMIAERKPESPAWGHISARLDAALDRLPRREREALVLTYLEGRSRPEAAAELGCPEGTVASRLGRGLARLRKLLGGERVGLSAAALGALLAERGAEAALPATFTAGLAAAAQGAAASSTAIAIAEGTMKAMTMVKIKIAATVICAATAAGAGGGVAVNHLAAAEPKKAARPKFLRNPKVAAMKGNSWIKLPTPKVHPRTRSSSPWMVYAPSLGKAFMWGACAGNSSTSNDLWNFDLAAGKWQQLLKAEPGVKRDPKVLKLKDNVLMTREEKPLGGHQWGGLDYDPDRKVIWHLPLNFPRQGSKNMFADCGDKLSFTPADYKKANAALKGPTLWKYDVAKNKWSWVHTQAPKGLFRNGKGTIRYCPPLRKLVMVSDFGDYIERFKLYDPDTRKWSMLGLTVKASALDVKKLPRYLGYHAPTVYDSKRKQFVIISAKGTWLMDPVKKTLDLAISEGKTLPACLDGPIGAFGYDSVGETVLGIFVNYTQYNSGKALKARGFPADRANVWALDLKEKKWVLQPKPTAGALPPLNERTGNLHHFYDPVQNATFIFRGGYNGSNGECWVYRYKRQPGK